MTTRLLITIPALAAALQISQHDQSASLDIDDDYQEGSMADEMAETEVEDAGAYTGDDQMYQPDDMPEGGEGAHGGPPDMPEGAGSGDDLKIEDNVEEDPEMSQEEKGIEDSASTLEHAVQHPEAEELARDGKGHVVSDETGEKEAEEAMEAVKEAVQAADADAEKAFEGVVDEADAAEKLIADTTEESAENAAKTEAYDDMPAGPDKSPEEIIAEATSAAEADAEYVGEDEVDDEEVAGVIPSDDDE
jgi:hypothetical protein